jgi:hypothetical protein
LSFSSDDPLLVNQLPLSIDFPKEQDKFREIITELYKRIANSVNTKEGGLYSLQELYNFNQFFKPNNPNQFRNVYRKVFDLIAINGGPIAGGATVTAPHNIKGLMSATNIYASCTSSTPTYFTVVYPDAYLDSVNLNFTNPLGSTTLTNVYFVAEYLKT